MATLTPLSNHPSSLFRIFWIEGLSQPFFCPKKRTLLLLEMEVNCWVLTQRADSPVLYHVLVRLLFGLSYIKGLYTPRCTAYATPLCFCLGVLSFGWTSLCLRVFLDLKCTGMSCLEKIQAPSITKTWMTKKLHRQECIQSDHFI